MMSKMVNPEYDFTIDEVVKMKWNKEGFNGGTRKHWLGEFDDDTHIAYNAVTIYETVKSTYGYKEVSYRVVINADYYGEKGTSKNYGDIGLKAVKANVMNLIKDAYANNQWFMKKVNLIG